MSRNIHSPYGKPGARGGTLIRKVIAFLKENGVSLPAVGGPQDYAIPSHILIAVSGGSDSVGLAHLLVHFGRRIVPRDKIQLLHINHGWRGEESDQDERFVENLAKEWNIPIAIHRLGSTPKEGASWEEKAREARQQIFQQEKQALVLTAHQADDLAETLLWRLFTGAGQTHAGGIAVQHQNQLRPFLNVRKTEIQAYLAEVGQSFRNDSTNQSERFMRARMRARLMTEIETLFPKAIEHLVDLALRLQAPSDSTRAEPFCGLLGAAGLKARRVHIQEILGKTDGTWKGEVHLPDGWILKREDSSTRHKVSQFKPLSHRNQLRDLSEKKCPTKVAKDRWILERF